MSHCLTNEALELLRELAKSYVWWKSPEEALKHPELIVSQVMNIGDYSDVQKMDSLINKEYLRQVILQADAGQFDKRSWHYWHYRLGLAAPGNVPPLPERNLT